MKEEQWRWRGQNWRSEGEQQHALSKAKAVGELSLIPLITHVDNGHKILLFYQTLFNDELCEICPSSGAMRCILYCIHGSCCNFCIHLWGYLLHSSLWYHWYRSPINCSPIGVGVWLDASIAKWKDGIRLVCVTHQIISVLVLIAHQRMLVSVDPSASNKLLHVSWLQLWRHLR